MDSGEERSELELTRLRKEIEKLEVDTRRAKHALPLGWHERRAGSGEGFRLAVEEECHAATTRVPQRIDEGGPRLVDRHQAGGAHGGLRAGLGRRVLAPVDRKGTLPVLRGGCASLLGVGQCSASEQLAG